MTFCEEGRWEEGMEGLAFEPGSGMPSGMKLGSEAKNSYLRNQPGLYWTSLVSRPDQNHLDFLTA